MTTYSRVFATLRCAIGLCALGASALQAAPVLQFANDTGSSVTLQVVTDATGALGAEVAVEIVASPTLEMTGVSVNAAIWDQPNPGDNPFLPGLPIGGDTTGLWTDLLSGQAFASFGAGSQPIGTLDFLTIDYTGYGNLEAFGLVAQQGNLNDGLVASTRVGVPEPSTAAVLAMGAISLLAARRRANV